MHKSEDKEKQGCRRFNCTSKWSQSDFISLVKNIVQRRCIEVFDTLIQQLFYIDHVATQSSFDVGAVYNSGHESC